MYAAQGGADSGALDGFTASRLWWNPAAFTLIQNSRDRYIVF